MINFRMDSEIIGINNDSVHLLRSLSFQDALYIGLMTIIHGQSYFDNILSGTIRQIGGMPLPSPCAASLSAGCPSLLPPLGSRRIQQKC